MSENPLDQTVTRTDPDSEMEQLAFRLLIEEQFHPSVVVARLGLHGCDRAAAQELVERISREDPHYERKQKGTAIVKILLWIALAAAACILLYGVFIAVILYVG